LSLSGSILLLICFVFVPPESWARCGAPFFFGAEHVRQLGGANSLPNLMEVKG
jgi:hypothetical protein